MRACAHCNTEHAGRSEERRSFCPACRSAGIPLKIARSEYEKRNAGRRQHARVRSQWSDSPRWQEIYR
jgi:hypothetical protein